MQSFPLGTYTDDKEPLLLRYQGHVGAALVLGGVDASGPQLFTVAPHGSTDKLPYVTMGSGSLAAMAVFESTWRAGLEVGFFYQILMILANTYISGI